MPGISLRINFKNKPEPLEDKISDATNSLLHNSDFFKTELINNAHCYVVFTGYEQYPLDKYNSADYDVFVEGKIYNKSKNELISVFSKLYEELNKSSFETKVKEWLKELDGDFIILIVDKLFGRYIIINDILGRLPFYIYSSVEHVIISREMKFIFKQIRKNEIEKFAVAESLLFGYPLGTKTYLKNIFRVPPGSLIIIDPSKQDLSTRQISDYNFENKEYKGKNLNTLVNNLAELFIDGTKNRIEDNSKNILSLSGGFDSRSVLGALKSIGINFTASTFSGYSKPSESDSKVAKLLSEALSFEWELIRIRNPLGEDIRNLLYYKDGTNNLWQSFLLIYASELLNRFGKNITLFTGDGGDKVFPDHRAAIKLSNVDSLVKYVISNKYFFTTKKISELLLINESEFIEHLKNHFDTYPEKEPGYKFLRFIIMERGIKWLFEAEDKNRFFFWNTAPMYSYPFFNYAMNITDELKKGYYLYYNFISKINPDSLKIKHALLGVPLNPDNIKYRSFILAKDKIYPRLPSFVKRILRTRLNKLNQFKTSDISIVDSLINDLSNKASVADIFNKKSLLNLGTINKTEFYILLTLLCSIEYYLENSSSMSNYIKEEFV
jgi:asparagine synthase (glutamine-hydrolysing)